MTEGGVVFGVVFGGGEGVFDEAETLLSLENFEEVIGDFLVNDVESGVRFDVVKDQGEVVVEFISDHRNVAVAKDEMRNAANNHDTHEKANWEDGGNASIRVVGEKVVPFIENVA